LDAIEKVIAGRLQALVAGLGGDSDGVAVLGRGVQISLGSPARLLIIPFDCDVFGLRRVGAGVHDQSAAHWVDVRQVITQ